MGCDVISAVNIVTGQRIATPENAKCYNHEDRDASYLTKVYKLKILKG